MAEATIHQGRNVKRLREMFGIKQEALALALGDEWNQQKISLLEQREVIDNAILEDVAIALKVPVDAIKNFNDGSAVNIISNTFTDFKDNASGINYCCSLTFNPLDKMVELYEALLKSEKEKNALLERFLAEKQ